MSFPESKSHPELERFLSFKGNDREATGGALDVFAPIEHANVGSHYILASNGTSGPVDEDGDGTINSYENFLSENEGIEDSSLVAALMENGAVHIGGNVSSFFGLWVIVNFGTDTLSTIGGVGAFLLFPAFTAYRIRSWFKHRSKVKEVKRVKQELEQLRARKSARAQ